MAELAKRCSSFGAAAVRIQYHSKHRPPRVLFPRELSYFFIFYLCELLLVLSLQLYDVLGKILALHAPRLSPAFLRGAWSCSPLCFWGDLPVETELYNLIMRVFFLVWFGFTLRNGMLLCRVWPVACLNYFVGLDLVVGGFERLLRKPLILMTYKCITSFPVFVVNSVLK